MTPERLDEVARQGLMNAIASEMPPAYLVGVIIGWLLLTDEPSNVELADKLNQAIGTNLKIK